MRNRITIVGSSNVDLVMKMARLPDPGETVTDAEFVQTFGGKGANQAVAAARAGGNVSFVNCVGDDVYAKPMLAGFRADGIDTTHIWQEKGIACGTALIMVGESGENYLSIAPGANYRLTPERIDEVRDLIADSAWVLLQYEIPVESIVRVLELAREVETPVIFNFAPARAFPLSHIALVDTLVVNETEAGQLAHRAVTDAATARDTAEELRALGPAVVVVTLGRDGSIVASHDGVVHVPAYPVKAIDTTAAGDTYCGCLAVARAEGRSLTDAVAFASAAAALSVQKLGAQPSAPGREEIDRFLDANGGATEG